MNTSGHFLTEVLLEDDSASFNTDQVDSQTLFTAGDSILDDETIESIGTKEFGLSTKECRKYYGGGGRIRFLKRFRWLNSQRSIGLSSSTDSTLKLLFDNENEDDDNDFPNVSSPRKSNFIDDNSVSDMSSVTFKQSVILPPIASYGKDSSSRSFKASFPAPSEELGAELTPRTAYIDSCMKDKVNPRVSLMVRKHMTRSFSLKSHGIGNHMARLFAESLNRLPNIHSMNIADNNLSDEGLSPILTALIKIPTLTELDLSQNEIGIPCERLY